jgi:FkbM family methyltransferase
MPLFPAGLSWRGRATYLAHAGKAIVRQHHRELLPLLRRFVPHDATVIDVGAHAGQFAKLFAHLAPAGRVYAFEPSTYARSILTLAVHARRLRNVTVVARGLGDAPGEAVLSTPIKTSGSVRYGLAHLGTGGAGRTEAVPIVTLDAFAAEQRLSRIDFVKADVEGWEARMLAGGEQTLRRWRPPMLLELVDGHLHRAGDDLHGAWSMLTGWGYTPHAWSGERLVPLATPRDGDSVWLPPGTSA